MVLSLLLLVGSSARSQDIGRQDVILALDNSGSMRRNDPQALMGKSVLAFAHELSPGARLGVIVFDAQALVALKLTPVGNPAFWIDLQRALSTIHYTGQRTDIAGAVERSIYELRQDHRPKARASIVLITDGILDTGSPTRDAERMVWLRTRLAQEAHDSSIRIMGVAFTDAADFELMQTLAQSTSGQHFRVSDSRKISETFALIASILAQPDQATDSIAKPPPATATQTEVGKNTVGSSYRLRAVASIVIVLLLLLSAIVWLRHQKATRLAIEATLTDLSNSDRAYTIKKTLTYVGRDRRSDIVIPEPTVGQRHALIRFDGNGFWVRDLHSRNGTWVNNERLDSGSDHFLHSGDIVRVHKYTFQFAQAGGVQTEIAERMTQVVSVFCINHPAKPAMEYCDECGKMYCNECVTSVGDRLLCGRCRANKVCTQQT
jgi:Mg-chelatase subunit ChlD